jgi:RimJ/RimL family protein N-acetyltransferase
VACSTTVSQTISLADKPTIDGELVLLRPVHPDDVDPADVDDPEGDKLTGSHPRPGGELTIEQRRNWFATRADYDDRLDLAVVDKATGRCAGEVVLNDLHPDNRPCSFRIYLFGARSRNRGLGTEATRLILRYAFETVGLHRVDLEVYEFNPRARRVYEKVGFVFEGTKRDALLWDGAWVDAHIMSILAAEWAEHRGYPGAQPPGPGRVGQIGARLS